MRKSKKTKSIDDLSVSKLLDDFVDLSAEESRRVRELDDDAYIRMMVEKEDKRKQERAKKIAVSSAHDEVQTSPEVEIKKSPAQIIEPEVETFPATCERDLSAEEESDIDEIMKTQDMMDKAALTGKTKVSVEFLQDEISTSEVKRNARKTLEKHRKERPIGERKGVSPVVSEKRAPIKRCQTCYFCVGERRVGGSCLSLIHI